MYFTIEFENNTLLVKRFHTLSQIMEKKFAFISLQLCIYEYLTKPHTSLQIGFFMISIEHDWIFVIVEYDGMSRFAS